MTTFMRFSCVLGTALLVAAASVQAQVDVTRPGDDIIGVAALLGDTTSSVATVGTVGGMNNYPGGEPPANVIDGIIVDSKYLNFAEINVGFIVALPEERSLANVTGIQFISANDAPERDPIVVSLEGANAANAMAAATSPTTWTTLYTGPSGLATDVVRYGLGTIQAFENDLYFNTYRLLVTEVQNAGAANSVQFAEVQLLGSIAVIPEPGTGLLLGLGMLGMWGLRRQSR